LEGSAWEIALACVTGMVGATALAAAIVGYGRRRLRMWERLLLATAAASLIKPGIVTDAYGLMVFTALMWRKESKVVPVAVDASREGEATAGIGSKGAGAS
jgi:TRAP-type uncharacterized transport system fused permease subunit